MKSDPRTKAKVRLIAVHTTEGIKRVGDLVAFFNRADASGSAHAAADATGALWGPERGYVSYDRAAWTLRSGNPVSDNLEYCGFAKTSRAQWLIDEAKGLDAIALWLADRSRARGIPLVKLSPADVKAGKAGVIGHVDWTTGMNDGTHWDPGPGFPWDVVLTKARWLLNPTPLPEDDNMPLTDDDIRRIWEFNYKGGPWIGDRVVGVDDKTGAIKTVTDKLGNHDAEINPAAKAVLDTKIVRGGDRAAAEWGPGSTTSLRGVVAWSDENLMLLGTQIAKAVASRDATQIAAAVPADLAKQVADELVARLKS